MSVTVKKTNHIEFDYRKFYEGQTVSVKIEGCNWRSFDGRISNILDGYLELDCSSQYKSDFKTIYLRDITSMIHLGRR